MRFVACAARSTTSCAFVAVDLAAFETFAIDQLQAVPGVFRVESLITMKIVKRDWPA
jgi:DNA-binding Lrp family transcriptional regulator